MIDFNLPPYTGKELDYIKQAVENKKICGDGQFTKQCQEWMENRFQAQKVLLTTSGTTALEMAAILCDLKEGDEVILPSYTFSSTATSIVLTGAKLVFVDIRPDTMNIDENKIEAAITDRTRAIVVVHYAGVACEMDAIIDIAKRHNLKVIEDAAQGVMSTYKGKALGTIGDFGCYSFHETKNYSMGEGGALVINSPEYNERAEILREKGTNRAKFFRGQVDKYTWVDYGSSYLPSDLNAAYLYAQLELADEINRNRLESWNYYKEQLKELADEELLELPTVPDGCVHNAHMFYVKLKNLKRRTEFIAYLREKGVQSTFHYIPLHSAPAGRRFGVFVGEDVYTTKESERLTRLPLYYHLSGEDRASVVQTIKEFFTDREDTRWIYQ
jgi:dTDP-4-amino-4,6-dideoxygalactose transaminase